MPLSLSRLPQNPNFVLRGAGDVPVHARQWFELPGRADGSAETWCYTDRLSYAPGARVALHAISTEPRLALEVWSEALRPVRMFEAQGLAAGWADTPEAASASGCGWPEVAGFRIGEDWPSGVYRLVLRAGDAGAAVEHLFVVRPAPSTRPGRLLLIVADATWTAYNDWGGSNHYEGIVDPDSNRFSARLSIHRPLARGMVRLPPDAPRTLPERPPQPGAPVRYPHMEWAWAHGYSKKYASAGWATYERHFAHWAEANGLAIEVATQRDLHARPDILEGVGCAVMVGHDEYWSWEMRDAIDAYVDRGGHVARFAGNFFWQIRMAEDGLSQICHKYRAETDDPYFRGDRAHLTTTLWEAPVVGRPGRATFGLDGSRGVYAGWGGLAAHGAGGFILYRPEHWAFAGTGLGYGDVIGAGARIFGYEVDGLDHHFSNGLPWPALQPSLPADLEILGHAPARLRETGGAPEDLFVADDDAELVAHLRLGDTSEAALEQVNRGSGMIVAFSRGKGAVFHAGTTEWVAGLMRRDPSVERITRNVLERFAAA